MDPWVQILIIVFAGLTFLLMLAAAVVVFYRGIFNPRQGTIEHVRIEAMREDMVGEARVKRINQLAPQDRALYMLFEMGKDLLHELNAGDAIKIRHYNSTNLSDLLGQFAQAPLATGAQLAQVMKDNGVWDLLVPLAAKQGINLEAIFQPKTEPSAPTGEKKDSPKVVEALPPPKVAAIPAPIQPAPDMRGQRAA